MGNKLNETFYYNKQCLYSAIESKDLDWIKLILDKTPSFVNEAMDSTNQTPPLHRAVWRNDRKVVDYLLDNYAADINL